MKNSCPQPPRRARLRFGIRQKVIVILVTVLLSAMTLSGWWAMEQARKDVLAETQQRGADISRFVAKSLAYSVVGYNYHTIQLLLDEITGAADIDYARVTSARGNVMAESWSHVAPDTSSAVPGAAALNKSMPVFEEPIMLDGSRVGTLELGLSAEPSIGRLRAQTMALLQREALIIFLIALGEFLALSYIIVRPARRMTEALAGTVDAEGAIIGKLPVLSNDEFGVLASQFNRLAAQLNSANRRLKSRIEISDKRLRESNEELIAQSEELMRINSELKRMSITDSLTGLYNRRHFEEIMSEEIALSNRYGDQNSLILIDIDHFKVINDTYGHSAGDAVLKELSHLLRCQFRKTDALCRVGGEEFIALCKRTDMEGAMRLAEKFRESIAQRTFAIGDAEVNISISAGVATVPDGGKTNTAEEFYRCADIALYLSKGNGRNRVTHYSEGVHDVQGES